MPQPQGAPPQEPDTAREPGLRRAIAHGFHSSRDEAVPAAMLCCLGGLPFPRSEK